MFGRVIDGSCWSMVYVLYYCSIIVFPLASRHKMQVSTRFAIFMAPGEDLLRTVEEVGRCSACSSCALVCALSQGSPRKGMTVVGSSHESDSGQASFSHVWHAQRMEV